MTATKAKQTAKDEAIAELRKILRPGDTVQCVLVNCSRSGMTRRIDFYKSERDGMRFLTGYIGKALEYTHSRKGGLVVGGCGMDMGFHVVHSLGYALWGGLAKKPGRIGAAVRRKLLAASGSYLTQGGRIAPDPNEADPAKLQDWFGAAGYALKHHWL